MRLTLYCQITMVDLIPEYLVMHPWTCSCLDFQKRSLLIGKLKPEDRNEYDFVKRVQVTTVRSSSKDTGVYINFCSVKYKDSLVLRSDLAGRKIQFTYDVRDVSHVRAYTMEGKFIGVLKASAALGAGKTLSSTPASSNQGFSRSYFEIQNWAELA